MSTAVSEISPSFRTLVRLVLQSALPRPQKAVLLALLAYARPDLTVYHAQEQLAWECDYTRPVIKQALTALRAQAILRVLQGPHQHYSTEYAIDLSRLPARAPYGSRAVTEDIMAEDGVATPAQRTNNLLAEDEVSFIQPVRKLPAGELGGKPIPPSGQLGDPQVVQVVQEKIFSSRDGSIPPGPDAGLRNGQPHAPPYQRPRRTTKRPRETPAPKTLFITDELHRWAADTVPGLPLEHERDKFLCYSRAHGLIHVDWSEALKFWWLEAHARAVRRGTLQFSAVPGSTTVPDWPPVYDAELHAQMQADVARLCGPTGPLMPRTSDGREPRRSHGSSIFAAEGIALERDPAYLAQMRERKAALQAQAVLLQAQESYLEALGAAD